MEKSQASIALSGKDRIEESVRKLRENREALRCKRLVTTHSFEKSIELKLRGIKPYNESEDVQV